jgi:hypothetical protein
MPTIHPLAAMRLISADAGAYMGCSAAEPCTAAVPWHGGDATAAAWAAVAASGTTYVTLAQQGFHRPGTVSQRENAERRERVRGAWRWLRVRDQAFHRRTLF